MSLLCNLICKIDRDVRYVKEEDKHKIAIMFFPLILRIIKDWNSVSLWINGDVGKLDAAHGNNYRIYERQELAASIVWILSSIKREWIRYWWTNSQQSDVFIKILREILSVFKFGSSLDQDFSTPYCTTSSIIDSLVDISKPEAAAGALKVRTRFGVRGVMAQKTSSQQEDDEPYRKKFLVSYSCWLISSFVHNMLDDFSEQVMLESLAKSNEISSSIFGLLQLLLENAICSENVKNVFALLSKFVRGNGGAMFRAHRTETGVLISLLLKGCSSDVALLRSHSISLFYWLMFQNHTTNGSCDIVKNAAILATARLAEDDETFGGVKFERSMNVLSQFALKELYEPKNAGFDTDLSEVTRRKSLFVRDIQSLSFALKKIVDDTRQIAKSVGSLEVEKVAEQYFRIAEGYRDIPELRIQWLEKLSQYHARNEDATEAAVSMAHVVALLADFVNSKTDATKIDVNVLKKLSPSISEIYYDDTGAVVSSSLDQKFMAKLKVAAKMVIKYLESAELYEMANEVFKVLLNVYHAEGNYRDLSSAHMNLERFFIKISENDESRMLGKYFRVGFYGSLFKDLNGQEFVYKEKLLTHLFALKERMLEHFEKAFGSGKAEVLEHGGTVNVSELDPNKAYLQITALKPCWDEGEEQRKTFFQRNTSLSQFTYETPFSKGGKVGQTGTADQWLKRTILTSEHSFPYILKRVPVIARREVIFSPIEIAIDLMEQRSERLRAEANRTPPDSKTLQQVLQGSVLTTVNRGVIEYLEIFLTNQSQFAPQFVKRLKQKFREFFVAAEHALAVNEEIIFEDQLEFHKEMEIGYRELLKLASPLCMDEEEEGGENESGTQSSTSSDRNLGSRSLSKELSSFISVSSVMSPRNSSPRSLNSPRLSSKKIQSDTMSSPRTSKKIQSDNMSSPRTSKKIQSDSSPIGSKKPHNDSTSPRSKKAESSPRVSGKRNPTDGEQLSRSSGTGTPSRPRKNTTNPNRRSLATSLQPDEK